MTAPQDRAATRLAILGTIRVLAYIVGIIAAAVGVTYAITTFAGEQVEIDGGLHYLPLPLALVHAGAFVASSFTAAAMAFIVGDLAWRIRRGVQFIPSVSRSVLGLAIVLAAGSWLAHVLQSLATQSGLLYPDTGDAMSMDPMTLPIGWSFSIDGLLPDGPLLGLAIVLGVLAYIVRAGERLQRDTEGLV